MYEIERERAENRQGAQQCSPVRLIGLVARAARLDEERRERVWMLSFHTCHAPVHRLKALLLKGALHFRFVQDHQGPNTDWQADQTTG